MGRRPKKDMGILTDFELLFMAVIWREGPSTVHDVLFYINRDEEGASYAYTTISTTLRILVNKGFLSTLPFGRSRIYSSNISREVYSLKVLNAFADSLYGGSNFELIQVAFRESHFKDSELATLQEILSEKSP